MQAFTEQVVTDFSVLTLCKTPYPHHPKGCPNYNTRPQCPPQCPLLGDVYNLSAGFWVVWINFDFAAHRKRMKRKHPNWSQRQIDCCLYWQGKANKMLREAVADMEYYLEGRRNWKTTFCPEAMGVNVTATMKILGVELEWPPQNIVRKVAIIGIKKKGK